VVAPTSNLPYRPAMRKEQFPWLLIGIPVLGYLVFHAVGLILAVLGLFIAYLVSIRLHPRVRHTGWRSCNGSGEVRGAIFTWTFRKCPNCNSGRLVRWGAGHFGAEHMQTEYRRSLEARRKAKQDGRWR
jgi:hypothetical protein